MYAQKKSIDNAHIVRERDRQRFRELFAVLALGIPIGLFLLLFAWQNLEVIRLGHQASQLQNQRKQIENENKALQFQLDRLTSLQSVEQKAKTLALERTDPRAVVMVEQSSRTDNRQPTTDHGKKR
jgi:cell division protein FtsL